MTSPKPSRRCASPPQSGNRDERYDLHHRLVIHARHGVMEHETEVGQRFVIDLELSARSRRPRARSPVRHRPMPSVVDDRDGGVQEHQLQAAGARGRRRRRRGSSRRFPRIDAVKVTVHKPHAPIAAIFEDVGVVLTRKRHVPDMAERADRARRQCRRRPRDIQQGDRQHLRHDAGRAAGAIVGLHHPALGRGRPGAVHQCLHRDRTSLDPHALLFTLHKIEQKFGRDRARDRTAGGRARSTST